MGCIGFLKQKGPHEEREREPYKLPMIYSKTCSNRHIKVLASPESDGWHTKGLGTEARTILCFDMAEK